MTLPTPKFALGDRVFFASTLPSTEKLPCPDCLETGKWTVRSPAGAEAEVTCPRCDGRKYLPLRSFAPTTSLLTIGKITAATSSSFSDDSLVQYMCQETGVGSGSIYNEDRLFATEEEAQRVAELLAAEQRDRLEKEEQPFRQEFRRLSTYQLRDAQVKEAEDAAWEYRNKYDRLVERICELDQFPVAFGRYSSSCALDEDQVKAVQESLVAHDEAACDKLDEWRKEAAE